MAICTNNCGTEKNAACHGAKRVSMPKDIKPSMDEVPSLQVGSGWTPRQGFLKLGARGVSRIWKREEEKKSLQITIWKFGRAF